MDDCKLLFSTFRSYDLVHIRRMANHAAHYLAKFALSNPDYVWIEDISSCIYVVLAFDLMSVIV